MKITQNKLSTNSGKNYCFVHARAAFGDDGFALITTQPLRLSGCDIFYGMHLIKSFDNGKTWEKIEESKTLTRKPLEDKYELAFADATPTYHKKSGKIILTGIGVLYINDERCPEPEPAEIVYAVYDEKKGDFDEIKVLDTGDKDKYFRCGSGCSQIYELENGDILLPIYHLDKEGAANTWKNCSKTSVIRCGFDGNELTIKEMGEEIIVTVPRGIGEPSVIGYNGDYYIALRNDETGYVAKSKDGINYSKPVPLCFDNGENAGNYNTQQHWITLDGRLYLVYTRKDASNEHVFRHRAPLFIAEFDTEKMCIIKSTEQIAVPERGARLGNFGCVNVSDGEAYVIAAEWMQSLKNENPWDECAKYGSDNSIWISKLEK